MLPPTSTASGVETIYEMFAGTKRKPAGQNTVRVSWDHVRFDRGRHATDFLRDVEIDVTSSDSLYFNAGNGEYKTNSSQ